MIEYAARLRPLQKNNCSRLLLNAASISAGAVHRVGNARSGERILVHGAAGGVGSALLDLGRLAGLEMYARHPTTTTNLYPTWVPLPSTTTVKTS